jgi:hypothetical protein
MCILSTVLTAGLMLADLDFLPFKKDGYNFWKWRDHKVHYVVQGEGKPIVLIHGFGASVFHWRYLLLVRSVLRCLYLSCIDCPSDMVLMLK